MQLGLMLCVCDVCVYVCGQAVVSGSGSNAAVIELGLGDSRWDVSSPRLDSN